MKSIKPGRGPSAMGAFGSIAIAVFGVFWTMMAVNMGAPGFFALFGIVFVIVAVAQFFYNYKNATGENRMSLFDLTEEHEESDPMQDYLRRSKNRDGSAKKSSESEGETCYCPYCGNLVRNEFAYCPKCGKHLK